MAQSTPDPLFLSGVGGVEVKSAVFGSAPGFGDEIQINGRMKREGVLGTVPIRRKRICTRGMRWLSWGEQQRISPPPHPFFPLKNWDEAMVWFKGGMWHFGGKSRMRMGFPWSKHQETLRRPLSHIKFKMPRWAGFQRWGEGQDGQGGGGGTKH